MRSALCVPSTGARRASGRRSGTATAATTDLPPRPASPIVRDEADAGRVGIVVPEPLLGIVGVEVDGPGETEVARTVKDRDVAEAAVDSAGEVDPAQAGVVAVSAVLALTRKEVAPAAPGRVGRCVALCRRVEPPVVAPQAHSAVVVLVIFSGFGPAHSWSDEDRMAGSPIARIVGSGETTNISPIIGRCGHGRKPGVTLSGPRKTARFRST
jgi:hypothetical protein